MDSSHVMMNTPSISSAPVTSFTSVRRNRFQFQSSPNSILRCPARAFPLWWRIRPVVAFSVRASGREKWDSPSPHQILGVPPSASIDEIKKAYRRLALKYHPDVNKEADAQEKFTRIKHAYNTILSTKSGNQKSGFSSSQSQREAAQKEAQEEFYGFGDFLRDAQEEYRNWEAAKQEKPKSLWQELADIGEEFVEFLEKELNISDSDGETATVNKETKPETPVESTLDEIEAALARLKSELGI